MLLTLFISFCLAIHFTVGTTVRCAPGWKEFNGSCYFAFIKPTATWSDARDVCKSLGADLIKITSAAENTFAYGLISGTEPNFHNRNTLLTVMTFRIRNEKQQKFNLLLNLFHFRCCFCFFFFLADLASLTHVWIGLHRGGDGTFYWVDGSSIGLGYSHWDTGEPGSSEKCGVFYSGQSVPSGWHDTDCNNSWGYICKMAKLK